MLITLREVLSLDVVRRGLPVVVAGADRLDVPVRWVHAVEVTDNVARLLRGGELILSTGIALPESDSALESYVAELAAAGVAGLAIELGRRYSVSLPEALVSAAAATGVVLIEFRAEVAFVELTEAVHTRIFEARAQLPDQRLRGLLYQLRDDPRMRVFADRELGALISYDAAHGTRLVADLAAFLEAGGTRRWRLRGRIWRGLRFTSGCGLSRRCWGCPWTMGSRGRRCMWHCWRFGLTNSTAPRCGRAAPAWRTPNS